MSTGEWSEQAVADLRRKWDAGDSTASIARDLGISKNAVLGKAHRLNLPPRPSPISKGRTAAADASETTKAQPIKPRTSSAVAAAVPAVVSGPQPSPIPPPVVRSPPAEGCKWPLWGFREDPTHRYCGERRADASKPYCAKHQALAFAPAKVQAAA